MPYTVYYTVCPETIPDHIANDCAGSLEHGRVRSVGFVHVSYLPTIQADPTDEALWITGIENKQIIIIPETTGTYDGGTPVDGPGFGDLESTIAGYNHVVTYQDPNFKDNAAFYNAIKTSRSWVPAIRLETTTMLFDKPATIVPQAPVTDDVNSVVTFNVELRISQPDIPEPFDTPPGVFIPFALA